MLNEDIVKGKWKAIKGRIQSAWGKLTDDELEQTKGDITSIAGLVQKRYGETVENARTKINGFIAELGEDKDRPTQRDFEKANRPV